jgi:hypothetical protein
MLIRTINTPIPQTTLPHPGQVAVTNPINWAKQSQEEVRITVNSSA